MVSAVKLIFSNLNATSRVDSSVPLAHHDPRDLGLTCLVKKRKIRFDEIYIPKSTHVLHIPTVNLAKVFFSYLAFVSL